MNTRLKYLPFSFMFFFFNYCILWTIFHILECKRAAPATISFYIALYAFISMTIPRFLVNACSRFLYYTVALWLGLLIHMMVFLCIYYTLSVFISFSKVQSLSIILLPPIAICSYGLKRARKLKIKNIDVQLPCVSSPIKIAHISDVHLGAIYHKEYSEYLVKQIMLLNPHFVAITGDLFDGSMKITPDMIEPFNSLPMNVYFVLGNHDNMRSDWDQLTNALSKTKIILVRNEVLSFNNVNIIGVDFSREPGYLVSQLSELFLPKNEVNILLYHSPDEKAEVLGKLNINLHLAGHTHGGQFPPVSLLPILVYPYFRGLHKSKEGDCYVYVTDGTGTAGPPLRIFSDSNISLINIHS